MRYPESCWVIFRFDSQLADHAQIDTYMILSTQDDQLLGSQSTPTMLSADEIKGLLMSAHQNHPWPAQLIFMKGDPIEEHIQTVAAEHAISIVAVSAEEIDAHTLATKYHLAEHIDSPSLMMLQADSDANEVACAKLMIPDSYDLCHCASGKQYKFCCKHVFRELIEAMYQAEAGQIDAAMQWLHQAREVVGENAEILCREAIILGYFDKAQAQAKLTACLAKYPDHPRANYVQAMYHRDHQAYEKAITHYQRAIEHYPETDHFHLNETYNNLGSIYYAMGDHLGAKKAWERALLYSPQDEYTQRNLKLLSHQPIQTDMTRH